MELTRSLTRLLEDFHRSNTWVELAALAVSLALAWLVCRTAGRDQPKDSVWFGRNTFDGLLFPVLALLLTWGAMHLVARWQPVALLKVAVPILMSLATIRLAARVLTSVFPESGLMRLVERIVSWVAWITAVLWIVGLLPAVMEEFDSIQLVFGKTHVSVRTLIEGSLSSGLVLVLTLWVSATLEKRVLRTAITDLSMRKIAINTTRAILLLVGLLLALSAVGVDLTALSVFGGAAGVGLGLGMQKLASNYVSGFVILLERSLRIGDNVKVDSFEGRITDIKTRYTLIKTPGGKESIVPNEMMIGQRVENLSVSDMKTNIQSVIVVGYESDVTQVQAILTGAAATQERVLTDPAPIAYLTNFAPDGLEFTLNFWIADPAKGKDNVRSAVNIEMLKGLRVAGVDIPYPQRVVRIEGRLPVEPTAEGKPVG